MGISMLELTEERSLTLSMILGLAPDHATLRSAELLAESGAWSEWGAAPHDDGRLLWAAFHEGKRSATHTLVLLPTLYVRCNCGATRFPCRHCIALLLRDATAAARASAPPSWVSAWLDEYARSFRPPTVDTAADTRRQATMAVAMVELGRWLGDLTGHGLANLPQQGRAPWQAMASRLVDARAHGAARQVRDLSTLWGSGTDWPERLLPRLGLLMLLAEGFGRLDELPAGQRGDLLAAAGWSPRTSDDQVADDWLVLGRRHESDGKQRRQRTWLRGLSSGRWALLEDTHRAQRIEGVCLPTGTIVRGELAYGASAWPLAARPVSPLRMTGATTGPAGGLSIDAAFDATSAARAANPWLRHFPLLLEGVIAEPAPDRWRLRDRGGRLLPLPPRFGHGWPVLALAGDRPLTLFGEWDGAVLTPLTVFHNGWHDMAAWKVYL